MLGLEATYTDTEIYEALLGMNPLKAPGPDGLQTIFYQKASAKGHLFCEACSEGLGEFGKNVGDPHILISKVESPSMINQFRPISSCNVIYKLVMKITVNRLKAIVEEIVMPN